MSMGHHDMNGPGATFSRDPTGLSAASASGSLLVDDGDSIDLAAKSVRTRIGDADVKMLGYGGSIPGPTLRVRQGSQATVLFRNETDLPTTIHWHGLRHDNQFDGVPQGLHRGMQPPVGPGETYTYSLRFPDPGIFWYHPHVREDYGQEQGLYGAILVEPIEPTYWAPTDREIILVLDDILIDDEYVSAFDAFESDHTLMGRYGNVMLANGDTHFTTKASVGEVARLHLVNAANTRTFDFAIPGARMKLVGADNGRVEKEQLIHDVVLAPSERAVVDVLFDRPGVLSMEHRTPNRVYHLGKVEVEAGLPVATHSANQFWTLRHSAELARARISLGSDTTRPPDKSINLIGRMTGKMSHHGMNSHVSEPIEWEDTMPEMNRTSTPATMGWAIVDDQSSAENMDIDWTFQLGEQVKLRITNSIHGDHPMQHPFHLHGQRFLVLSRNGITSDNLAWKDTVLVMTGETVDLLIEMTNPGRWMAHCHIAEHLEAGMVLTFEVKPNEKKDSR